MSALNSAASRACFQANPQSCTSSKGFCCEARERVCVQGEAGKGCERHGCRLHGLHRQICSAGAGNVVAIARAKSKQQAEMNLSGGAATAEVCFALEFQKAKLRLESELQKQGRVTWSIVRPAFFKSLGGQVEIVKGGGPFVVFGDGKFCSCKPISESDLAAFISDCISDSEKLNRLLPIGGPGKACTPLEQGKMIVGRQPNILKVPIQIMDTAIGLLGYLAKIFPALEDPAEYAKIGRYYAAESMLVMDPVTGEYDEDATPSYGEETLEQFFERVVELGEQAPAAFLQQQRC